MSKRVAPDELSHQKRLTPARWQELEPGGNVGEKAADGHRRAGLSSHLTTPYDLAGSHQNDRTRLALANTRREFNLGD